LFRVMPATIFACAPPTIPAMLLVMEVM